VTITATNPDDPISYLEIGGCVTTAMLEIARPYINGEISRESSDLGGMASLAKANCLAKIDSTPYEFGEDIVEMKKTMEFIEEQGNLVRKLNKNAKSSLHGNYQFLKHPSSRKILRHFKDGLDHQAKAHLVLSFGYGNVLRSALNAMDAWNERERAIPVQRKASDTQQFRSVSRSTLERLFNQNLSYGDYFFRSEAVFDTVKATVLYHHRDPVSDFRFQLGIRGKDLLPTAWNVVPASWFIDSFYNISNSIKAVENILDPSIVVDRAWITTRSARQSVSQYVYSKNTGYIYSGSGEPLTIEEDFKQRSPWIPSWQDAFPNRIKLPTRASTIMNDAAYAWILLSRRIPRINV
jgi:hypothetical protein